MTSQQNAYSMHATYELGDKCLAMISQDIENQRQWFLSAKLCYLLATIEHPSNKKEYINAQKLQQLEQLKSTYNITITHNTKEKFPNEVLRLLRAFYAVWLPEIRQYLKERISTRIDKRQDAFMVIFQKFSDQVIDVSRAKKEILKQHDDDVDAWEGPEFQHLKMENNQRGKNVDYLSAVKDKDGYKKRCANSQDNWSKKGDYDAKFFAVCIQKACQSFGSNMALRVQFGKEILNEQVKFKCAPKTYLILNSWMFSRANCKLLIAITKLLDVDKTKCNGGRGSHQKRANLMSLCEQQCKIYCRQNENDNADMKDENNMDDGISVMPFSNSTVATTPNPPIDGHQQRLNVNYNNNNVMLQSSSLNGTSTSTEYKSTSTQITSVDINQSPQNMFTDNNNNNVNNQTQQPSFNGLDQSRNMHNNQILQAPQYINYQHHQTVVIPLHSQHVFVQHRNDIYPVNDQYQHHSQHPPLINNMMNDNNNNYNQHRLYHGSQTQNQSVTPSNPQYNHQQQQQQTVHNMHNISYGQYQLPPQQQQYMNNNMMNRNNNGNGNNQQNNSNHNNDTDMSAPCIHCGAYNQCNHR